MKTKNN